MKLEVFALNVIFLNLSYYLVNRGEQGLFFRGNQYNLCFGNVMKATIVFWECDDQWGTPVSSVTDWMLFPDGL